MGTVIGQYRQRKEYLDGATDIAPLAPRQSNWPARLGPCTPKGIQGHLAAVSENYTSIDSWSSDVARLSRTWIDHHLLASFTCTQKHLTGSWFIITISYKSYYFLSSLSGFLVTPSVTLNQYNISLYHLSSGNTTYYCTLAIKIQYLGFPGGAVVENLPANAGDAGSSPGLGGSHMPRSNWACEPQLLSLSVWSLCSATGEAAIVRGPRTAMKSGPHSP